MIKTYRKSLCLVLLLLNLGIFETKKMHKTSFDWFSMDLPLFPREDFCVVFAYKKESCLVLGNFHIISLILVYVISVRFIITSQIGYTEFHQNLWKIISCLTLEIHIAKLKYTDTTPPFQMEIRLVHTEENVCKDTENYELQS